MTEGATQDMQLRKQEGKHQVRAGRSNWITGIYSQKFTYSG